MEIIPMTDDICLKGVMKSNKEFFIKLVSKILQVPEEEIVNGEFVDNEVINEKKKDIHSKVDLIYETKNKIINMEGNNYKDGITRRNNLYIFRLEVDCFYLKSEERYNFYQINIDKAKFDYNDKLINIFETRNIETGKKLEEMPIIIHIALEQLENAEYTKNIDKWLLSALRLFKATTVKEYEEICGKDKILRKVMKFMINYSKNKTVIGEYDYEREQELIKQWGLEESKEEGINQGKEEGIAKNKQAVALEMIKDNVDDRLISKYTKLHINEINKIKKLYLKKD